MPEPPSQKLLNERSKSGVEAPAVDITLTDVNEQSDRMAGHRGILEAIAPEFTNTRLMNSSSMTLEKDVRDHRVLSSKAVNQLPEAVDESEGAEIRDTQIQQSEEAMNVAESNANFNIVRYAGYAFQIIAYIYNNVSDRIIC